MENEMKKSASTKSLQDVRNEESIDKLPRCHSEADLRPVKPIRRAKKKYKAPMPPIGIKIPSPSLKRSKSPRRGSLMSPVLEESESPGEKDHKQRSHSYVSFFGLDDTQGKSQESKVYKQEKISEESFGGKVPSINIDKSHLQNGEKMSQCEVVSHDLSHEQDAIESMDIVNVPTSEVMSQGICQVNDSVDCLSQVNEDDASHADECVTQETNNMTHSAQSVGHSKSEEGKTADHVGQTADDVRQQADHLNQTADDVSQTDDVMNQPADDVSQIADDVSRSADDVGQIADHKSRSAVDVGQTADDVNQKEDDLNQIADHKSQSAVDVGQTADNVNKKEDVVSQKADHESQSADDVSLTADDISKQAQAVRQTADYEGQTSDVLSETVGAINQLAEEMSQTADAMSQSADAMSQSADAMSQSADDASLTADQMSQTADDVSQTADDVSQSADQMSQTADGEIVTASSASRLSNDSKRQEAESLSQTAKKSGQCDHDTENQTANGVSQTSVGLIRGELSSNLGESDSRKVAKSCQKNSISKSENGEPRQGIDQECQTNDENVKESTIKGEDPFEIKLEYGGMSQVELGQGQDELHDDNSQSDKEANQADKKNANLNKSSEFVTHHPQQDEITREENQVGRTSLEKKHGETAAGDSGQNSSEIEVNSKDEEESYPKELNPFGGDEDQDEAVDTFDDYPESFNPFAEKEKTGVKISKSQSLTSLTETGVQQRRKSRKKSRAPPPPAGVRPFSLIM